MALALAMLVALKIVSLISQLSVASFCDKVVRRVPLELPESQVSRVIGKACWVAALKDAKTSLTKDQRASHWQENKKEYVRMGRVILRELEKSGYKISAQ